MIEILQAIATVMACGLVPFAMTGYPCCCGPAEFTCDENCAAEPPEEISLYINGTSAGWCSGCGDVDGTYILGPVGSSSSPQTVVWSFTIPICQWGPEAPLSGWPNIRNSPGLGFGSCTTPNSASITLWAGNSTALGDGWHLEIRWATGVQRDGWYFQKAESEPIDCSPSSLSLTFGGYIGGGIDAGPACFPPTTCQITAV